MQNSSQDTSRDSHESHPSFSFNEPTALFPPQLLDSQRQTMDDTTPTRDPLQNVNIDHSIHPEQPGAPPATWTPPVLSADQIARMTEGMTEEDFRKVMETIQNEDATVEEALIANGHTPRAP